MRQLIAQGVLGNDHVAARLGSVRLHAHQRHAVARIQRAITEAGGVLLADAVGLGKTYVALATARTFRKTLVIAPAVLRSTWMESAAMAEVEIHFVSTESLSRTRVGRMRTELVIVDEAHHFRNPRTRRYLQIAHLTAATPVLLLTATPVHNRAADLSALLALFLGSAASSLTPDELARYVIRREHADTGLRLPALGRMQRVEIEARESVARAILALPPPVPPRDGGEATRLVQLGLHHMWMSSDAAAISGIRQRLSAGAAMRACLLEGRVPGRRELRSWLCADGTVQLGFTELLVEPVSVPGRIALGTLDAHLAALQDLLRLIRSGPSRDAHRAFELRRLRSIHPGQRMLAFSSYAATVHALFRELAPDGEVAAATARGGTIASGPAARDEVLRMFRSPGHRRAVVKLLLATDLLSEGLNLPEASIVIHLDLPWTAARLEQRLGRVRRPGGSTGVVQTYAFVQPRVIERLTGKERLIAVKARVAKDTVGALGHDNSGTTGGVASPPRATEGIRTVLRRWARSVGMPHQDDRIPVAAVRAQRTGFLALIRKRDSHTLIADATDSVHGEITGASAARTRQLSATTDPNRVHATLAISGGTSSPVEGRNYLTARRAIARWMVDSELRRSSGTRSPPVPELRALLQRLEAATAASPLHIRADTALRVSRIREKLSGRIPRGLEILMTECARSVGDDARLIDALDALTASTRESRIPVDGELVAVLLLQRIGHPGD